MTTNLPLNITRANLSYFIGDSGEGPYVYEPLASPAITRVQTATGALIQKHESLRRLLVDDISQFPDEEGYLCFGLGWDHQESPVRYLGKTTVTTENYYDTYTNGVLGGSVVHFGYTTTLNEVSLPNGGRFVSMREYSPTALPAVSSRAVIYNVVGNVPTGDPVFVSDNYHVGQALGWNELVFSNECVLPPGDYAFGFMHNGSLDVSYRRWANPAAGMDSWSEPMVWPNPDMGMSAPSITQIGWQFAMYLVSATVTEYLLIDANRRFEHEHPIGTSVILLAGRAGHEPGADEGSLSLTNSGLGLRSAEAIVDHISATGLPVEKSISYPPDHGLGGGGAPTKGDGKLSDVVRVFGGDNLDEEVEKARER